MKVAKYLYPSAQIVEGDLRFYQSKATQDIIFGNPPFNLSWKVKNKNYTSQMFYFLKAYEALKPGGFLAIITPNSFLSDEFQNQNDIKTINNRFNFICQFELPRNAFRAVGVENFETKVLFFQKKSQHLESQDYDLEKIEIADLSEETAEGVCSYFIEPLKGAKAKIKGKLFFEAKASNPETEFNYQIKKLLYDIKRNPKTSADFQKCLDYLERFRTQERPAHMTEEEWELSKLTPEKVLNYLNKKLKKQNHQEIEKTELVKTKYGLELKAYSKNQKHLLNQFAGVRKISFNEMILEDRYPFEDDRYMGLFEQKKKAYLKQNIPLSELPGDPKIREWLKDLTFVKPAKDLFGKEEIIKFNDRQVSDLETILQKDNPPILNWWMGCGKTLAAIAWFKYILENKKNVRNVFVLSSAISINNTWAETLKEFGIGFNQLSSLKDVQSIKPGQIVICTLNMLVKYQKHISRYIKSQNKKIAFIFDESHRMVNPQTETSKAVLSVFRRVKYKLLTTGTATLNNINEIYPQLELLYNNSVNFISKNEFTYRIDKEGQLVKELNPNYNKPFPAWHGMALFKTSFSPAKQSVFGIKKFNQDIYNIDILKELVGKSVLTRTFKEITGEDKYRFIPHSIQQNEAEREVYRVIIEEFYRIVNNYFENTGNSRKESGLQIVRQIQLLIQATSCPHFMDEYAGNDLPEKYYRVFQIIRELQFQKVAIGTLFKDTAKDYCKQLKMKFPDRPVFLILGEISFKKRKKIIQEFERTENGILVSTQASLSESENIPTVDHCIIESVQWNMPKILQYAFRFVRYNSKNFKYLHLLSYSGTLEQNLIALLMDKERLNEFIKTLEYPDREDIFAEHGIGMDVLDSVMEKEVDDLTGKVKVKWGQAKAC